MRLPILMFVLPALFLFDFDLSAQRIGAIDEHQIVTIPGNRPPLARAEYDAGPVAPDFPMQHMILALRPSAAQRSALAALLEAQQDPESASYRQWLTPQQFETQFGVSETDASAVAGWLTSHGFSIDEIPAGRRSIIFSGTAAQVADAFHTEIHIYNVGGEIHHANASDPQIPQALAEVVAGTVSLHDFRRAPAHANLTAAPQYTSGSTHYLAPADFATIYDVAALYSSSINGTGQTIAIVGRTNIQVSDVQTFRSTFGLAANNPTVIVNGTNPGIVSTDEEAEADLDVEWSGAIAPKATVKFVVSASTRSTDGVDLSAQYIVSNNVAPVMSTSFGSCEASMGSAEMAFYDNLWQQAAAEGITALIAAGDSGVAGCDAGSSSSGAGGIGVNGLCSSPYSVCVGGTEFNEGGNNNLYWSAANTAAYGSALSYIPEVAWNESGLVSGGSGLWATGGGASAYYSKPSWQSGPGVPADGKRDVPDLALSAAGHDGYFVQILGSMYIISGTSAASPSMAGLMALVNQKTAARQGNANPTFYGLANLASSGGAAVFHGTAGGNNSVPGLTGFTAGPHYNQATGLGSADAFVLANHWGDLHASSGFSVSTGSSSVTVPQGSAQSMAVAVAVSGGFSGAVAFSISGLPSGVTASFSPASFAAPGSGSSTLKLTAASSATAGSSTLTISAASGSTVHTAQVALTVQPVFTISASVSTLTVQPGKSATATLTSKAGAGFSSSIALSISGAPTGVTASWSSSTISAPGSGSSVLTLTVASTAAEGAHVLTISGTGGGLTQQISLSLTIAGPTFTLTAAPAAFSLAPGASQQVQLGVTAVNGFNAAVAFSASALPSGVTAAFNGRVLTMTAGTSAAPGTYAITVTGSSAGVTPSPAVVLTLTVERFGLTTSTPSVTVARGHSVPVTLLFAAASTFRGSLAFTIAGLPTGVTPTLAATSANATSTTFTLTLTASNTAPLGTVSATVAVASGGVSVSQAINVTVN